MKESAIDQLTHRQLLLVLTYAPAGLGHLRIMDALYHGLPETVNPVVLGSQDRSIEIIHRLTSIYPIGRAVFQWLETGPLSSQANSLYRYSLRMNTGIVYDEMARLLDERMESPEKILVSIPISGAAVGTEYFSRLIALLREKSDRFLFHVVMKDAPFTKNFLSHLAGKPWVDLHVGKRDREVVDLYDVLMKEKTVSLEVTKPSEQAFKGLLGTQARGGVILLFSQPVGSQEYDNLDFLVRHSLVPSKETNAQLWEMVGDNARMDPALRSRLFEESRTWRGVRIPNDPQEASDFIWWMLTSGVFARMLAGNLDLKVKDEQSGFLGSDGVAEFWHLATSV